MGSIPTSGTSFRSSMYVPRRNCFGIESQRLEAPQQHAGLSRQYLKRDSTDVRICARPSYGCDHSSSAPRFGICSRSGTWLAAPQQAMTGTATCLMGAGDRISSAISTLTLAGFKGIIEVWKALCPSSTWPQMNIDSRNFYPHNPCCTPKQAKQIIGSADRL